jgi:MSHA biogenesis protein MshL
VRVLKLPVFGAVWILCAALGCATSHKVSGARADVEHEIEGLQMKAGTQAQGDPVYKVTPGVFITDGRRLPVPRNANLPELFNKTFALRGRIHSVREVASLLSTQVALPVNVAPELLAQTASAQAGTAAPASQERAWDVEFDGPLVSFLDALGAQFGAYWEYENGRITIYRTHTRVFALSATPGKLSVSDSITNQSQVGTSESGGASLASGGSTAQGSNSSGGYQEVQLKTETDVWTQVMADVRSQLSASGRAEANPAAGIVTVTDTPPVLDRVSEYISAVNSRLNRQIALTIRLYALTMSTERALGFSLDAVFNGTTGLKVSLAGAQPFTAPTGIATANAVVLPAATGRLTQWVDTDLLVQALKSAGRIAQVTEMSVITRNNRAAPVQQTDTTTYIAQASSVVAANAGSTSSLLPGTVVSGFSGLITPHVLDDGRVLLQYGVTLVVLNSIAQLKSADQTIGGPDYTRRAFDAEMVIRPGETVAVVPYKEDVTRKQGATGIWSWSSDTARNRTVVVMTITMDVLPT